MSEEWLAAGQGIPPTRRWSFTTDAPLVALCTARESGETVLADSSGGLYLLDRDGQVQAITHGFQGIRDLCWSDLGGGAVLLGERKVSRLEPHLRVSWSLELHDDVRVLAIDPHGHYVAVSLANGETQLFAPSRRKIAEWTTIRPLSFLKFETSSAAIVSAADHGLLCRHELDGTEVWNAKLWSNVGDLDITDDGSRIHIAAFNQGIQTYDGEGRSCESFIVGGTPERIAVTAWPHRMVATTVERHLYWLDEDGELLWAAASPERIRVASCDPLGRWITCGFEEGRVLRLAWDAPHSQAVEPDLLAE